MQGIIQQYNTHPALPRGHWRWKFLIPYKYFTYIAQKVIISSIFYDNIVIFLYEY